MPCWSVWAIGTCCFEQADTSLSVSKLTIISAVLAVVGAAVAIFLKLHVALIPLVCLCFGPAAAGVGDILSQQAVEDIRRPVARRPGDARPRAAPGRAWPSASAWWARK